MGGKWNNQGWYKGKGRNYRGGGGGRGGRSSSSQNAYQDVYEETTEKRFASNTDKHLSKAHLRSYIGQDGPFFVSGAQDEEVVFAVRAIARTRTTYNCEGFNRLG